MGVPEPEQRAVGSREMTEKLLFGVVVLCAAFAALWGAFITFIPSHRWVGAEWYNLDVQALYLGTAVWAYWPYKRAETRPRRLLFFFIIAVSTLSLATDAVGSFRPRLAVPLHHPMETVLGYSLSALVTVGMFIEARDWQRRSLEKR